ncbi:MAG: hypothetical protein ACI8W3_001923, partial [Myxococcota bacterium]
QKKCVAAALVKDFVPGRQTVAYDAPRVGNLEGRV